MEWIKWLIALGVALIGHIGLWCVAYNRIHASARPRSSRKLSEKIIFLVVIIPIVYMTTAVVEWIKQGGAPGFNERLLGNHRFHLETIGFLYLTICCLLGIYFLLRWIYRKLKFRLPQSVLSSSQSVVDLQAEIKTPLLHGFVANYLGKIPKNEILQLGINRMSFELDVPPQIDGLRICHLSDLHFTGQIDVKYFENVVEKANEFAPDIVIISGDIVDNRDCLPWLDSTLGQLKPTLGSYYVLGNHDRRIREEQMYRGRLESLGLTRVAGRWKSASFHGQEIKITGNELPWYKGAECLPTEPGGREAALKILVSHSPDQIDWARPYGFDLMFAGHTHGGQIAIPVVGPIVAPSKYGVLYAAGTFEIDGTLMHVSRGLSGDEPIRFGCPPELGLFTIRSINAPNSRETLLDETQTTVVNEETVQMTTSSVQS